MEIFVRSILRQHDEHRLAATRSPHPLNAPGLSVVSGRMCGMHESEAELDELQQLLDTSLFRSSGHLRSIVTGERTLTARQLVDVVAGMCTLAISTVTAGGEPRISGVDGHFLHGRWVFGTDRSAAKAEHLRARPAASAAHLRGEQLGVFTHGAVAVLNPTDGAQDPHWPAVLEHLTEHYGDSPLNWGDVVYYRLEPHWMVSYGDPDELISDARDD